MDGELLDIAMLQLAHKARIIVGGMISQYNIPVPTTGPKYYGMLLVKQACMEGFLAGHFKDRYPEARERIAGCRTDRLSHGS